MLSLKTFLLICLSLLTKRHSPKFTLSNLTCYASYILFHLKFFKYNQYEKSKKTIYEKISFSTFIIYPFLFFCLQSYTLFAFQDSFFFHYFLFRYVS